MAFYAGGRDARSLSKELVFLFSNGSPRRKGGRLAPTRERRYNDAAPSILNLDLQFPAKMTVLCSCFATPNPLFPRLLSTVNQAAASKGSWA